MDYQKNTVQPLRPDLPVYSALQAAALLKVHPNTLRRYQAAGLVKPARYGLRLLFSANDLKWIECLRTMIHGQGLTIAGLQKLLRLLPCWQVAGCAQCCPAQVDWSIPRTLHLVGDRISAKEINRGRTAGQMTLRSVK